MADVRRLALTIDRPEPVPAVVWLPPEPAKATILVGHGGGDSKDGHAMTRLGRQLASRLGYATVVIDAPYHGDRTPADERELSPSARRAKVGGMAAWRERNQDAVPQAVADWRATLDTVHGMAGIGEAPVGYWGVSMGTRIGVPLIAAEPRIVAAVLGLFGHRDTGNPLFAEAARAIHIPLLFILQWDDTQFPRAGGFALFDLFGSTDKTLHANPGDHLDVPRVQSQESIRFLQRQLEPRPAG